MAIRALRTGALGIGLPMDERSPSASSDTRAETAFGSRIGAWPRWAKGAWRRLAVGLKLASIGMAVSLPILMSAQTLGQTANTRVVISVSPATSTFGQSVRLWLNVDTEGTPAAAGSVTFKDGATSLGVVQLQALGVEITDIAAGLSFTCALSTAGNVWCWGSDSIGQLGDGRTDAQSTTPLRIPLGNAVQITAGREHACALLANGYVRCWGRALEGQVGNGSNPDSSTDVLVSNLSNAIAIDAGDYHTCAVTSTGGAKCWGAGVSGQLGNGGAQNQNQPVDVIGLTGATSISAGSSHTCAVVTGGAATCWGNGSHGQLGTGNAQSHTTPVAVVGLTGATSITAGGVHTCALVAGGSVKCWGNGQYGQLGDGSQDYKPAPVDVVGILGATKITSTYLHTCALFAFGDMKCWGEGQSSQLGDGGTSNRSTPVDVLGLRNAIAIATGETHTCAVINDGTVNCWGSSTSGELGFTPVSNTATAKTVDGLSGATAVVAGAAHTCALVTGGAVRCFGNGEFGQLGNNRLKVSSASPVVVSFLNGQPLAGASLLAAGANHVCAIRTGIDVVCWGKGDAGQLGDGNLGNVGHPVPVSLSGSPSAISAGGDTTCVILGGQVKCWGEGSDGQLGDGRSVDSALPVTVSGITNAVSIAVGGKFACAVDGSNFSVKCWGKNDDGQLGWGFLASSATPVLATTGLPFLPVFIRRIHAGEAHVCGYSTTNLAHCWGRGTSGQLGNGTNVNNGYLSISAATGLFGNFTLSLGGDTSCAFQSGAVSCWGAGGSGQNGSTTFSSRLTPVALPDLASNVTAMAVGSAHACAVLTGGTVRCWGDNASGQIGQPVPNLPGRLPNFTLANRATASIVIAPQQLAGGSHTLSATFAPTSEHAAASVSVSHTVNRATQDLQFPKPGDRVFSPLTIVDMWFNVNTGLPLTTTTSTPQVCVIEQATTARLLSAGFCTVTVSQAGNGNYLPVSITRTFEIVKSEQTITFAQPAAQVFAPGKLVALPATTTGQSLTVALASTTPDVCAISGASALLLGAGTCSVTASQAGNSSYLAATPVTRSFQISKATQTLTFEQPAAQVFAPGKLVALSATTTGQSLTVDLASTTPDVCAISGASALLLGAGTCAVTASQVGNSGYLAATPVSRSFPVTAALRPQVSALAATARLHEQGQAALAPFRSGVVMAYASRVAATGPYAILRQVLNSTGAASGTPLVIAPAATGVGEPDVAGLTAGYVVVWQAPDGASSGIFAQRFGATGAKLGAVIAVNASVAGTQGRPRVAALPGGGFAVVWQMVIGSADADVWMRVFGATGAPLGAEQRVNTSTARRQNMPDIAALATGTIAITWADERGAGRYAVRHRLYASSGAPITAPLETAALNQALNPTPVIAARTGTGAASGFAVAYARSEVATVASPADIETQLIDPTGAKTGSALRVNTIGAGAQASPAIAPLKEGAFAVAFTTPDDSSTGIAVRAFSAAGAALGSEEQVNQVTTSAQFAPALGPIGPMGATLGTRFLAAWTTRGATAADRNDIAARPFQGP